MWENRDVEEVKIKLPLGCSNKEQAELDSNHKVSRRFRHEEVKSSKQKSEIAEYHTDSLALQHKRPFSLTVGHKD